MDLVHTMMVISQLCYKWVNISLQSGGLFRHGLCQCCFHGTWYGDLRTCSTCDRISYRTSATNCARQYNYTLNGSEPPVGWQFGFGVTTEQVWDGFVTLALLEDCQWRSKVLEVPHTGLQKDRFTAALQQRNLRFWIHGQPESWH